jgi:hypothetical protein
MKKKAAARQSRFHPSAFILHPYFSVSRHGLAAERGVNRDLVQG